VVERRDSQEYPAGASQQLNTARLLVENEDFRLLLLTEECPACGSTRILLRQLKIITPSNTIRYLAERKICVSCKQEVLHETSPDVPGLSNSARD